MVSSLSAVLVWATAPFTVSLYRVRFFSLQLFPTVATKVRWIAFQLIRKRATRIATDFYGLQQHAHARDSV